MPERPTRTKKRSAWSEKLRKARQGGQLSDSDEVNEAKGNPVDRASFLVG